MDYLSLCLIAKDESEYLKEWVDYHILLGVERFYIYDNESAVSIRTTLHEQILAGWVNVIDISGKGQQLIAYDHCLQTFGKLSRWIGFIDTDEFLVPKKTTSLPEFLERYEDFGGLAVSSLFFGAGGNQKKPLAGQIASYRQRTPTNYRTNRLVKSIVQPEKTLWPMSPHFFACRENHFCVNEDFLRIDYQQFPHHSEKIQLNHYYTRSYEEISEKFQRGRGDAGIPYQQSRFDSINQAADTPDDQILDVIKKIFSASHINGFSLKKLNPKSTELLEKIHEAASQKKAASVPILNLSPVIPRKEYLGYQEKVTLSSELTRQKNWAQAMRSTLELIELMPQCVSHLTDFAAICMQRNDFLSAWQAIAQAWKIAPQTHLVLLMMADYYMMIQDYGWLEKISQMLITQNPQENTSYFPLSFSLLHQGQIEKGLKLALTILPDLLEGSPYDQFRANLLIKTIQPHLFARNEIQIISTLFTSAIKLNPTDISLYITLIQINLELKNFKTARGIIKDALRIEPENAEILALEGKTKQVLL
jgi:cytochrome c-type biogenesis protein CcmH/NrfG